MDVELERIYDAGPRTGPRHRVLVDRLWPRRMSMAKADLDEWLKDVAPSTELRRWYGHDVDLFDEFRRRYRDELGRPPAADALAALAETAEGDGVLLLTATRDVEHSGAIVLEQVLTGLRGAR